MKGTKQSVALTKIVSQARHRNGIGGRPFEVFIIEEPTEDMTGKRKMLVVRFDGANEDCATAAFDLDKLAQGDIEFGSNSWRGDHYHDVMRAISPEES